MTGFEPDRPGYEYEVWPGETDPCEGVKARLADRDAKIAGAREGFEVIAASAGSRTLTRKRADQIRDRALAEIEKLGA